MMTNQTELIALTAAIADFAHALATASDSSIDDAQLHADALFDLLDDDDRAFFNDPINLDAFTDHDTIPAAINRDALDELDRAAYDALRTAYLALLDARP